VTLADLRQHRLGARLAWWLSALLVAQLMLPLQAHARIARDAHGVAVVICTLEGPRTVQLALDGSDQVQHPHASAAMAFSDLLNHFTPVAPVVRPPAVLLQRVGILAEPTAPAVFARAPVPVGRGPPQS